MSIEKKFFHIELEHLKGQILFPFHLYIYNPYNKKYSPFIFANSPFSEEKKSFLGFILDKKGKLAVPMGQKKTFLRNMELLEEDIEFFKTEETTEEEKEKENIQNILSLRDQESPFHFKNELLSCLEKDNFLPLILRAQEEITCFDLRISSTVSIAREMAKKLLIEDNYNNRVVALSYFVAKIFDIKKDSDLSSLLLASFFHHLGHTQMEISMAQKPVKEYMADERQRYSKHVGLSQHLLKKSKIDLDERCFKIINQTHERVDGTGFPASLKGNHIDFLAQILGLVTHIMEFSSGRISGNTQAIDSTIRMIKNKNFIPGLEFGFDDKIIENIEQIFSKEEIKNAA